MIQKIEGTELNGYRRVQEIAKQVHTQLGQFMTHSSCELSIAKKASELLTELGANDTWYHGVPAFVLLGTRSCLSISGKDYIPSRESVGDVNLITVDLSPMIDGVWGDCARSYCIEGGSHSPQPLYEPFVEGLSIELQLHNIMKSFVSPETRFKELYEFGNDQIQRFGYENLDFLSNLGHSIEKDLNERKFIDKECDVRLGDAAYFTFEPHIRKLGDNWGYKHENMYYFDTSGHVNEL